MNEGHNYIFYRSIRLGVFAKATLFSGYFYHV